NSGNPIAATVSNGGLVSALSVGQANITATCDGTVNSSILAQITPVPVSSVTITPGSLNLTGGMQGQLLAVARDSAGNVLSLQGRTVTWLTDNQPVASVTNAGVVQGGQPGDANITAVVDGVASAPVTVTVVTMFSAVTPTVDPRFADRRLQSVVASR
ncbi:MAG TPA: Ig-like domain-containing protein, partial [Gemmatimonadaceae bacterium]|nr:Ig-like domain-containing protein [Gemmatimonadaceae bacterium]